MFDNNYPPYRTARRAGWRKQAWRTLILRSAIVLPALPLLLVAGLNGNTATLITFILWLGMLGWQVYRSWNVLFGHPDYRNSGYPAYAPRQAPPAGANAPGYPYQPGRTAPRPRASQAPHQGYRVRRSNAGSAFDQPRRSGPAGAAFNLPPQGMMLDGGAPAPWAQAGQPPAISCPQCGSGDTHLERKLGLQVCEDCRYRFNPNGGGTAWEAW